MPTTDLSPATPCSGPAQLFPPAFFPSAGRYVAMAAIVARGGIPAVATAQRYDKRAKWVHRTMVADTRGELRLTVPVVRPDGASTGTLTWSDVGVSRHDRWWEIHRTTLESAYGRTPFFEFYIDRFLPFFSKSTPDDFASIAELDIAAERVVTDILLLPEPVAAAQSCRAADIPAAPDPGPYWQVRADRFGFIPGMSILDLIFNCGPESALIIRNTPLS